MERGDNGNIGAISLGGFFPFKSSEAYTRVLYALGCLISSLEWRATKHTRGLWWGGVCYGIQVASPLVFCHRKRKRKKHERSKPPGFF